MVTDLARLRAMVFERTGLAIDEHDPIMAVLAASAYQSEEIGARLLERARPARVVLASAVIALACAAVASWGTWQVARSHGRLEHAEWRRQMSNPRLAVLMQSEQGQAAVTLAELGVAKLLVHCAGRRSWRVVEGYCVPITGDGKPDGFRIRDDVKESK